MGCHTERMDEFLRTVFIKKFHCYQCGSSNVAGMRLKEESLNGSKEQYEEICKEYSKEKCQCGGCGAIHEVSANSIKWN